MVALIKTFYALAAAAAAASMAIPADSGSATLTYLQQTDQDTVALGNANRGFNGSIESTVPILAGVTKLYADLEITATITEVATQFTSQQAEAIISFFNSPLNPDTNSTIGATEDNKSSIEQAGLTPVVEALFVLLLSAVKELSSAILAKTPKPQQQAAQQALSTFESFYQGGVNDFAS